MASQKPPADRKDFRIAIICALPLEADALNLLFDQFWDDDRDPYGRADGDTNTYITGCIRGHHVVLAVLPTMGTNSAAAATASLRSSYTNLKLAILVGICGGVPRIANFDAFLGDVIVSKTIVQYDYGRQHDGHFSAKSTVEDSLGRANKDIRSLLAVFETVLMRERLQADASRHLKHLQEAANKRRRRVNYQYPGTNEDKLYPPTYMHRHRKWCSVCADNPDVFCKSASKASCVEAGCDPANLVVRERVHDLVQGGDFIPEIFIGQVGSGNTVMKSGKDRDRIAAEYDLIAFEMEGAGAWDEVPCIVVKGICDYADSHKNKVWQDFAAATAASVVKAILGRYPVYDGDRGPTQPNDERHIDGSSIANNPFEHSAWVNQGDAACFKESRLVPATTQLADPEPTRSQERKDDTGERKWRKIRDYRQRMNRCLNCGLRGHWERACPEACGKCLYRKHTASWCSHPVRCIKCKEQGHIAEDCSEDGETSVCEYKWDV